MSTLAQTCLLAGAVALCGCATITRGTSNDVQFVSTPSGAAVTTSLGPACTTPCTLKFDRRDTFTATFKLGDQEEQVFVDTEVAGGGVAATAGNVLAGGIIGIGVDVATGAGLNHVPNPVTVTFDPVPAEAPAEVDAEAPAAPVAVDTPEPSETRDDGFNWGG